MQNKKQLIAIAAALLMLSACGTKDYYRAVEAREVRLANQPPPPPLVSHAWTDRDGTGHQLTVNQPICGAQRAEPIIVSPWEVPLRVFDRTMTTLERLVPGLSLLTGGAGRNTVTYNAGGNIITNSTNGEDSGVGFQPDHSTKHETTTVENQ